MNASFACLRRKETEVELENDKREEMASEGTEAFSGQDARRHFLKNSGRVAIAAPAVVLLLAAASKGAVAQNGNGSYSGRTEAPKSKNLLDPP
jgi:hypothetical protein